MQEPGPFIQTLSGRRVNPFDEPWDPQHAAREFLERYERLSAP